MLALLASVALAATDDAGCRLADEGTSGCVDSIADHVQHLDGVLVHKQRSYFLDLYVDSFYGDVPVGLVVTGDYPYVRGGIGADLVVAPYHHGLFWYGNRGWGDPDSNVVVQGLVYRDGGTEFSVQAPGACFAQSLFSVANGPISYGASVNPDCSSGEGGYLFHRGGFSGSPSFVREPGQYTAFITSLAAFTLGHDYFNADNTRPVYDGGTTGIVVLRHGDQNYYAEGSRHPEFELRAGARKYAGKLFGVSVNDTEDHGYTELKASIDWNGGWVMGANFTRATLPTCGFVMVPVRNQIDGPTGQLFFNAEASARYWLRDEKRWVYCDGDTWQTELNASDISAILTYLDARLLDAGIP